MRPLPATSNLYAGLEVPKPKLPEASRRILSTLLVKNNKGLALVTCIAGFVPP